MSYDPNDDDRRIDILRKRDDNLNGALMGGIAIALLLLFGIAIFTLSSRNQESVITDKLRTEQTKPAPSTTGQGGTSTVPGRDQITITPPPANPSQPTPK